MSFEKFTKTGRGYAPKVSIWTRGQIGFNQGAVERYGISNYEYAVLYYDREHKQIGISFTNDPNEEGINKIVKGKTGAFLSAKSFLDYYNVDRSENKKYDIVYDETNKLYVIQLD